MEFNAELVIRYLTEVLKIEDPEDFTDVPLKQDFFDMMRGEKHEWNLEFVEPVQVLEMIILEQLLISRCQSMELQEVIEEFYYPHFNPTFFDPEPRPKLSIAGWLNYNYGRDYEIEADHLPPLSLAPVVDIIKLLVESSPTCDEMITEYITDIYLGFRDNDSDDLRHEFFLGEGADQTYNLSKVLHAVKPYIVRLAENSFEDDLPHILGQLIVEDLNDEFLEVFLADYNEEEITTHPLLLVQNQINGLMGLYSD